MDVELNAHEARVLGVLIEKTIDLGDGVKITMVLIPPGEFLMGSTEEERAQLNVMLEEGEQLEEELGFHPIVRHTIHLCLEEDGENTLLKYSVSAAVGGKIAQIGARLVQVAARKLTDEFFGKFNQLMEKR